MKIGFVVNQTPKEHPEYTTTGLALAAHKLGFEVYYIGVGSFAYLANGKVGAHARQAPARAFRSAHTFLEAVVEAEKKLVDFGRMDVLWLRNDPSIDMDKRPWAQDAGVIFGQLAAAQGVLVLNNPDGLVKASSKMYLEYFPDEVRPRTVVTRELADVEQFYERENNRIILKPLRGSGGKNVFLLDKKEGKNKKQIIEAIIRDGFVIAQEYLPAAKDGDTRVFLVDGKPLEIDGKVAAIRRVQAPGDLRSNVHQGATVKTPVLTKQTFRLIETIGPQLRADGMYLVGLDIVGSKLMEINVFSPGGIGQASRLNGVDYFTAIMQDVEAKAKAHKATRTKAKKDEA